MRSSRSLRLSILLFGGVLAVATVLRAQETPPATAPADHTAPAQAAPAAPATAVTPGEPAGPAAPPAPKGQTPARFEPTEKVRADFDVSFPIDI